MKLKINFNAPVILTFSALCIILFFTDQITSARISRLFFYLDGRSINTGTTLQLILRLFLHSFSHFDYNHLASNMILILLIGPAVEEKTGSLRLFIIIATTSLISGIIHYAFYPDSTLAGASDILYMLIILGSFTQVKQGYFPLTFILITFIFFGREIYSLAAGNTTNISHAAHIAGVTIGVIAGIFIFIRKDRGKKIELSNDNFEQ